MSGIRVLRAGAGMALTVWFLLPLVPLLLWAVADTWDAPARLPQDWGGRGLELALAEGGVAASGRSVLLGLVVAGIATPLGAAAARALALRTAPLPRLVSVLLFLPVALPLFAVVLGIDVTLLRLRVPGLVGIVLVLVVVALPYTTYLMRVAYGAYDSAFEDEARTLGAAPRAVRWRVRRPLLAPGLAGAAFLAFLVGWSDYLVTLLVGGGRLVTLPLLVAATASGTGNEPTVAVLSLAAVLPPVLVLVGVGLLRRRVGGVR
ncbi:ABC transporter permease [Nocardioides coralli]|uniref:ABC transporter permease n=1 Tax=Nocardioides coralli TaxID=2872154 RepID=UPI001CA394C3|nr:ABC transporter permease subunit [Nocardioides coralli]QZY30132.1 ABC transporter permease subunit [Nocardioides coralli]